MAKGLYQHLAETRRKSGDELEGIEKGRLIQWRREPTVVKVPGPTRVDRARAVGYKAKHGYVIARVKIGKGGRRRKLYGRRGRKPTKMGLVHFSHGKSLQKIAEEKAQRKFINMDVIGSYLVGEDGKHKWFESVMIDPQHPNIKNNVKMRWATLPANRKVSLRSR